MLAGLALLWQWKYSLSKGFVSQPALDAAFTRRIVTAQCLYLGAALLCLVHPLLAIGAIISVQLNYALGLTHRGKPVPTH
jgi:hypothetical protein